MAKDRLMDVCWLFLWNDEGRGFFLSSTINTATLSSHWPGVWRWESRQVEIPTGTVFFQLSTTVLFFITTDALTERLFNVSNFIFFLIHCISPLAITAGFWLGLQLRPFWTATFTYLQTWLDNTPALKALTAEDSLLQNLTEAEILSVTTKNFVLNTSIWKTTPNDSWYTG